MRRKGVSYDVGRVMGGNWRPTFDLRVVRRELEIIKQDLHCNAVRICGLALDRLMPAAQYALELGLEVWLSPEMWDKSPHDTLEYITQAAMAAEPLNAKWPERLVLLVGSELTLFMQGIVPGKNIIRRMRHPEFWTRAKAGVHNKPLNAFLAQANKSVRQVFGGQLSYASLIWEAVDWSLFDFVGVDHYRNVRINDRDVEILAPLFTHGKPVVITEFGCRTYQGADTSTAGMAGDLTDYSLKLSVMINYLTNAVRSSLFGIQLPPPRMRLKPGHLRDEQLQARELTNTLGILERAGVDGTFIMTFVSPTAPFNPNPRDDLDMNSYSLVKSYDDKLGTTYPDMPWEPKASFQAVADFYAHGLTS